MPSDSLALVTTGLGVSVVAGIVSGVFYVITNGFSLAWTKRRRQSKRLTPWHCYVCGGHFRSVRGVLEVERVVTCTGCRERICKEKCAFRDPEKGWRCKFCQQPDSWFKGILKSIQPHSFRVFYNNSSMDPDKLEEADEDLLALEKQEKEQVRDFIERLLEAMLGGDLDNVKVTRLYNDPKYDSLFSRYHTDISSALTDLGSALHISLANLPVTGQSPCSAHASLKYLIQRFIKEAVELPHLEKNLDDDAAQSLDGPDRTYEDLLATTIINKVIQSYQDDLHSSRASSRSSRRTSSSRARSNKEYFFGDQTLDNKYRKSDCFEDGSSVSSIDEFLRSDSSMGSTKYVDPVSLKIRHNIDELSCHSDVEVDENRDVLPETISLSRIPSTASDYEENWILQKRRYQNSHSPVPVPMLVPNPTTEAKVLIGDTEIDETSDLSDANSDYGDTELVPGLNTVLIESKTLIGGKNSVGSISDDSVTDDADLKEEKDDILQKFLDEERNNNTLNLEEFRNIVETTNSAILNDSGVEHDSFQSLESNTEQDTEYTEKYGSLPRTILKESPKPKPRLQNGNKATIVEETEMKKPKNGSLTSSSSESEGSEFVGNYSRKEKEKWKHPVNMPNNPYSPESIERRLSLKKSNNYISDTYGRDYYIKEAKKSAGSRKTPTDEEVPFTPEIINYEANHEVDSVFEVQEHLPENQEENNTLIEEETPAPVPKARTSITKPEQPITEDLHVFKATPVIIKDDSDLESSLDPVRPNTLEISSDSDLSIERSYNLQTGKVVTRVGDIQKEIVKGSKSPEGIKYLPLQERKLLIDENHNVPYNFKEYEEQEENILLSNETYSSGGNLMGNGYAGSEKSFEADEPYRSLDSSLEAEQEITELQEKKLVKNILQKFGGSKDKIEIVKNDLTEPIVEEEPKKLEVVEDIQVSLKEEELVLPRVKNLKKLFDNAKKSEGKLAVYSLTARSIPKSVRQELKSQDSETPVDEGKDAAIVEETEQKEEENHEEIEEFPRAKSRIAFFERLKST